jgi:hypothetical protein
MFQCVCAVKYQKKNNQIQLPPLVDGEKNPKTREGLVTILENTRSRYRQFRNRLSAELKATRGTGEGKKIVFIRKI